MFKKIIGTVTTRIVIGAISLLIVLMNQRVLGAEKVGNIALIILSVTILQLISSVFGGSALIFLLPRTRLIKLLIPSYVWSVIIALAGAPLLNLFRETTAGQGYAIHVAMLTILLSLGTTNQMILMGRERIREFNLVTLLQTIVLFLSLVCGFFVFRYKEIGSFLNALYFSYGVGMIVSLWLIIPEIKKEGPESNNWKVIKEMFHFGSTMQSANFFQFLNYRMNYYFINTFLGKGPLGIFSVGTSLSESIWILAKSISGVQYTRISNENDPAYAAKLTLTFVKISFIFTLIALIALLIVIHWLFPFIFRPEFLPVKYIMAILSGGILVFSVSIVLSPFFSGTGSPGHNMISSALGLVFTIVAGFLLIPRYGLAGASIAAVISYTAGTLYQLIIFIRMSGFHLKDFLLTRAELLTAGRFFLSLQSKNSSL